MRCSSLVLMNPVFRQNYLSEIDDFGNWALPYMFDFIHEHALGDSIHHCDRLHAEAFQSLKPGEYLELQSLELETMYLTGGNFRWRALMVNSANSSKKYSVKCFAFQRVLSEKLRS